MLEMAAAVTLMLCNDGLDAAASLIDAAIEAPFILTAVGARTGCAGPLACRCLARQPSTVKCSQDLTFMMQPVA